MAINKATPAPIDGDVKVVVANNSRQLEKFRQGGWAVLSAGDPTGLPTGIFNLAHASKASANVYPQTYGGPVVHVDQDHVYQVGAKGVVEHSRGLFATPPVIGRNYEVKYSRGMGQVLGEISQAAGAKIEQSRGRSL